MASKKMIKFKYPCTQLNENKMDSDDRFEY